MPRIRSHFAIEEKIALKNLPIKRKKGRKLIACTKLIEWYSIPKRLLICNILALF